MSMLRATLPPLEPGRFLPPELALFLLARRLYRSVVFVVVGPVLFLFGRGAASPVRAP
ncbi:MAG: hypothetical protein KDA27_13390 [Candidatus Eisenbacteria bacterium]|uniref:Uncharacterized protein n=1 Tax=Eiseniibacteriota bacterium TaxID=2212470 RepID=A0A956ND19_UNCEI|nr:hypothetical protein [Candidatus Eisenbacteria bacterium]